MKLRSIAAIAILLSAATLSLEAAHEDMSDELSGPSKAIIYKYLEASNQQSSPRSIQVDIDASVPKLKEHATLRALRKISNVGKITYRVLGFQGDNTVKKEVIARYLQAEQESQSNANIAITPTNYKFKLKGQKQLQNQQLVYIFQVEPKKKRVGLFKGEVWLDAMSFLPVVEKGRLVKNPSIFFKKVDFERAFAVQKGVSVLAHMSSTIDTRVVGKVELDVNYTTVDDGSDDDVSSGDAETAAVFPIAAALR